MTDGLGAKWTLPKLVEKGWHVHLDDAARLVGVPLSVMREWVWAGRLPAVKLSGKWRVRAADLQQLIAAMPLQEAVQHLAARQAEQVYRTIPPYKRSLLVPETHAASDLRARRSLARAEAVARPPLRWP